MRRLNPPKATTARHRKPASLSAAEVLERVTDGFVALDREWRYTYVNQKAGELFGRRPEDLVGKHIWTEFPEGVGQPFHLAYEKAMETQEPVVLEDHYEPWDRWFENRVYPSPNGLSIYFHEITDRKRAEQALRETDQFNRLLFETSPIGLALCRMDGSLIDVNPAYADTIGRTVVEVLQLTYWDITPKKYAEEERRQLESLETDGRYGPYEKQYIHKDGHLVPVRLWGLIVERKGERFIWSSVEDLTERRRAEQILEDQRVVLELTARGAPLASTLEELARRIEAHNPKMRCSVLLLDEDGLHLRHGAAPSLPEAYAAAIDGGVIGPAAGSCGTAAFRRAQVIVTDIATDPLWLNYRDLALLHGLRACWSTPIFSSEGRVLGTFAMYYDEPCAPTRDDLELIERAVDLASNAIERARGEEALRESEARFRHLTEATSAAIYIHQEGKLRYANHAAERLTGYTRDELLGKDLMELVHRDSRKLVRERGLARLRGEEVVSNYEFKVVTKGGDERWGEGTAVQFDYAGAPATLATAYDITERKQAEAAVRTSEALYHDLVETSQDLIWQCDAEGRYVYLNPAWAEVFGYRLEEMLGRRFSDFQAPEVAARDLKEFARLLQGGTVKGFETVHLGKGGNEIHLAFTAKFLTDESGNTVGTRGTAYDITERKRAEENVREQVAMLRALNAGARELTESLDLAEVAGGVARACVESFGARLAWIGQAVPDGSVSLLYHFPPGIEYPHAITVRWDDAPAGQGPTGRAIRSGAPQIMEDIAASRDFAPWRAAAVEQGFCTSAAFPLLSRGRPFGVLNLYGDEPGFFSPERMEFFQTFAHQAAAALENARLYGDLQREAELLEERVQRRTADLAEINAELDAFAYSVSHDLRAPLRAMQGFGQALIEDYGPQLDETARDYVRRITGAAEHMDSMIGDLLTYSRLTRAELQVAPLELQAVVSNVLERMAVELAEGRTRVEVTAPLPAVMADRATLEAVLTNLLTNAVKFVAPGVPPEVRIGASRNGPVVRIWVEDNGIGIAPEHVGRIFRVFERLHGVETYPGTGIGLAIVRKGTERMGGQAGVESEPGNGSLFWIELRAVEEVV